MFLNTDFFMFNIMRMVIPIIVICGFIFVIGNLIYISYKNAKQNSINNASPVLSVNAKVCSKRVEVKNVGNHNMHNYRTRTKYFATFEVESTDRIEFSITGEQSGLLMENDYGTLKFQGTKYLNFTRTRNNQE